MATRIAPLMDILSTIPDPRHRKGRVYKLSSILGLMCAASLCGYQTYGAMVEWCRNYGQEYALALGFPPLRSPCKATLCILLARIDVEAMEGQLCEWMEAVLSALDLGELAFSLDGKSLRGSRKQGATFPAVLAAFGHEVGVVLCQRGIPEGGRPVGVAAEGEDAVYRTNELRIAKEMLKALLIDGRLEGRIWTMDALHTQRENAETILEGKGDYVMLAKGNQPTLQEDIEFLFREGGAPEEWFDDASEMDSGHGRIEHRSIRTSTILNETLGWSGVQQVFEVHRARVERPSGKLHEETVYGITSLSPQRADPSRLMELVRGHWSIENGLHWVRDVVFDEDRSQVRKGNTPEVMTAVRNCVISVLRLTGQQTNAAARRRYAARPREALALIGVIMEN
ncbi:ISAs1 family transposase [Candidatus Poribacteria bacterium]|jgi:predicted transposase YbfD/YdcC|nr:ISAs1 family transposase [Gemmatimonadota bacterium]MBT5534486.1 ISAs1 family transposase [Candidatus Poribacteria bacterium]MBT5709735.1 ISAs1 family transposase [Candidatus Poribacteria bacterium]MBT7098585.1 ISAs1 family transposase [Candidatus Poribacteria bacterium]